MQDRSLITIDNILAAAQRLFTQKQYADVTLKEIADNAGVTKGALYHHFASKEELYLAMMHHYLAQIQKSTLASLKATEGRSCRERLYESLCGFLGLPGEILSVVRLVRRDSNIFQEPVRQALIRAYQAALPEPLEAVVAEGIAARDIIMSDARLLTWHYIALVEVSIHPYGRKILGGPEAMAESLVNLLFHGVASQKLTEQGFTQQNKSNTEPLMNQ